jgi:hypothetical protein
MFRRSVIVLAGSGEIHAALRDRTGLMKSQSATISLIASNDTRWKGASAWASFEAKAKGAKMDDVARSKRIW